MPRVAKDLYASGKDKNQQDKVREFLKKIGVREVGEKERVEAVLRARYLWEKSSQKIQDIKRFIDFVEQYPGQANMFKSYFIFKLTDGKWGKPSEVYLDSPFCETGLSAYYDALGDDAQRRTSYHGNDELRWALYEDYEKCGIDHGKIGKFAEAVGARTKLCIKKQGVSLWHPEKLKKSYDRKTDYETGRDYDIAILNG